MINEKVQCDVTVGLGEIEETALGKSSHSEYRVQIGAGWTAPRVLKHIHSQPKAQIGGGWIAPRVLKHAGAGR
ncbi:MAG: hypothetical protein ABJO66_05490 [Parvibaculum sp.]|uniref:hypothetical protein n=1 Tax=Alphaproteobacteria TaxID=28211 RepID=UPI003299E51E